MIKKLKTKNGFTIVELVIVIAIIAILAAVLIPTFGNLIERANLSSDQVAVKNMNLFLKTYEIDNGKVKDAANAKKALKLGGYNGDKLVPVTIDHKFYWDSVENMVILVNEKDNTVYYPEGASFVKNNTRYIPLDGIPTAELTSKAPSELKVFVGDSNGNPTTLQITMEKGLKFECDPNETEEKAKASSYGEYYVDFVVTFSKKLTYEGNPENIKDGDVGFMLLGNYSGNYGTFSWVPLAITTSDGTSVEPNGPQKIRLLKEKMSGLQLKYYELPEGVSDFECGIKAVYDNRFSDTFTEYDNQQMDDLDKEFLDGLEVKVELCLFDPTTDELVAVVNTYECEYRVVGNSLTVIDK